MPSLRKKPAEPTVEPDLLVKTNGKGRATPTRKEAQATRKSSPTARRTTSRPGARPGDPKASKQALRDARRAKAAEYRAAMNSGDVNKLPARERVPERILARDVVDERRNLGPVLLAIIVVAYFLGLVPSTPLRAIAFYLLPLCLLGIIVDSFRVARKASREVAARYPNSTVKVKGAVAQRAIMPARWRQPRPRNGIVVGRWLPKFF